MSHALRPSHLGEWKELKTKWMHPGRLSSLPCIKTSTTLESALRSRSLCLLAVSSGRLNNHLASVISTSIITTGRHHHRYPRYVSVAGIVSQEEPVARVFQAVPLEPNFKCQRYDSGSSLLPCSMFPLCSLRKAAHKADEEKDVEMKDLLRSSGLSLRTGYLLKVSFRV